jgi:hypothetical protein
MAWPLLPEVKGDAYFPQPNHRLWLTRSWEGDAVGNVLHIGMNPSLAGADRDDRTVRKDQEFTKRMGFCRMVKCNVGTFISTDPRGVPESSAACHPDNVKTILHWAALSCRIVVATGKPPDPLLSAARLLFKRLKLEGYKMECFGLTKDHWPKHSSRLAYAARLVEFVW